MSDATLEMPPARARPATWRVAGASVRGTSHARLNQPCEDAHAWRLLPGGAVAIAVADGAGSAAHADAGARAAVHAAVDALAAAVKGAPEGWTAALDAALSAALAAVQGEAARRGTEVRELACTLIVAVATADLVAVAQVGDGGLVVATDEGLRALTTPVSGEFANETVFLTTPGAVGGAQRNVWRGSARQLAAFTDGLQGLALKMPAREPHAPFFTPLFGFAAESAGSAKADAELAAFLQGPRVTARADDDLTLVLAARD